MQKNLVGWVQRMLDGKVIAITRDEERARHFVKMVESNKGKAIALPTISLIPKDSGVMLKFLQLLKAKKYDYTLFMSATAVNMIFDFLGKIQKDNDVVSMLNHTKVIAVGPHTKEALENHHVTVWMMPKKYSSYGVLELFSKENSSDKKIIIPRSSAATNYLVKSLSDIGMIVDELHIYDVKPAEHGKWSGFMKTLIRGEIDCMVFTSASSVNSFFEVARGYEKQQHVREVLKLVKVIAIGPFTNDALLDQKVEAVVADEHSINGTFKVAVRLLGRE
ncbi:MAG: uroporphyrinogen-III synthase [Nitrososphaerales archaeon]